MNQMTYNFAEHAHRYACWTAARAASISRFSNSEISGFIEAIQLRQQVEQLQQKDTVSKDLFRDWFIATAEELAQTMAAYLPKLQPGKAILKRNISFGIAAKVIAIYIKTFDVLPSRGQSVLAAVAYPPIDSILIGNLSKKWPIDKSIKWSQLDQEKFMRLLDDISRNFGDHPWWKLEENWKADRNNITIETSNDDEH